MGRVAASSGPLKPELLCLLLVCREAYQNFYFVRTLASVHSPPASVTFSPFTEEEETRGRPVSSTSDLDAAAAPPYAHRTSAKLVCPLALRVHPFTAPTKPRWPLLSTTSHAAHS